VTHVDEPALEDEATARLFEAAVQRARGTSFGVLMLLPMAALTGWMWFSTPVLAVFMAGALLVMMWQLLTHWMPGGSRWPAAARRLLEDEPWRETNATVLDTRGTVLALPSGEHVRVHGLPAPAREVAVRAGRVWTVGPDAAGWLAVRVDGLHTPWPAQQIAARNAEPAAPTAEPVTTIWVRRLVREARGTLWLALLAAIGFVLLTVFAHADLWLVAAAVAIGAVGVAAAAWQVRHVARLRPVGPWQRADATVSSWTNRMQGRADGTIAVRFPDGHRYTAHLEGVPVDLFANAWREETLWVAGNGVVGFPDYSVIALAYLTPES